MAANHRQVRPVRTAFRGIALGRPFAIATTVLVLAACAQPTQLERSSLASGVAANEALALPPPGGPSVVGVIERRYSNAIQQDIVLAANTQIAGQNFLRVQLFGPVGSDGGANELADRRLASADIRREMREFFPGMPLGQSPYYVQNSYGPFGYAVGVRGADTCIFAWQRLATSGTGAPLAQTGTAQVRLRLCQTGASEQSLLAVMYGYTFTTSFSARHWNPYGEPPAADPRLGTTGQPIYPVGVTGAVTVVEPAPLPAPRRPRPTRPAAPAQPAIPSPPDDAPVVPPPPEE